MDKDKYVKMIRDFADKFMDEGEIKTAYLKLVDDMYSTLEDTWLPEEEEEDSHDIPIEVVYTKNYNGGNMAEPLKYEKEGDSGFDLRAQNNEEGVWTVAPQGTIVVPVGIKVAVPRGFELQVRTRSGSPIKRGFNVANSPGTVDSGYRGVVGVLVHNLTHGNIEIACGERIAQGVIVPVMEAKFVEVDALDITDRGDGAYNSTGVH